MESLYQQNTGTVQKRDHNISETTRCTRKKQQSCSRMGLVKQEVERKIEFKIRVLVSSFRYSGDLTEGMRNEETIIPF